MENTREIEVAERTQREHLSLIGIVVALHIVGVGSNYCLGLLQHQVTIVDGRIEGSPRGECILSLNVHRVNLRQGRLVGSRDRQRRRHDELVGAEIAPDNHVAYGRSVAQLCIGSSHNGFHLALLLPVVVVDGLVVRQDHRVDTAGRHEGSCKNAKIKQLH